jgi:hypothetical protein
MRRRAVDQTLLPAAVSQLGDHVFAFALTLSLPARCVDTASQFLCDCMS